MAHVSVSLPPAHAQTQVVSRANARLLHVSDGHVSCGCLHRGEVQRTAHLSHLLTLRRDLAAEGPEGCRPDEIDHGGRAVCAGSSRCPSNPCVHDAQGVRRGDSGPKCQLSAARRRSVTMVLVYVDLPCICYFYLQAVHAMSRLALSTVGSRLNLPVRAADRCRGRV